MLRWFSRAQLPEAACVDSRPGVSLDHTSPLKESPALLFPPQVSCLVCGDVSPKNCLVKPLGGSINGCLRNLYCHTSPCSEQAASVNLSHWPLQPALQCISVNAVSTLCPGVSAWWARETPGAALDICHRFTTSCMGAVDGTLVLSVLQLTRLGCGYPAVPNACMSLEQNAQHS